MNYQLHNPNDLAKVALDTQELSDSLTLLRLTVDSSQSLVPKTIDLSFSFPCDDLYSFWTPTMGSSRHLRPDWAKTDGKSRLASGMPLHQAISLSGRNRMTVALSDASVPTKIAMGVCEETSEITCKISFFTRLVAPLSHYEAQIRLDREAVAFHCALTNAVAWWESSCGYPQAPVPEHARLPMYSTWYSFHQRLDVPEVVEQCRLAKELGMETVIVDDGWQTDDNNRGYAYCGDWQVAEKKMGDMRRFVDLVHRQGMKFMLWFSVPFVGIHSRAFEEFKDMLLDGNEPADALGFHCLDPRYPKVRRYLVDTYFRSAKEWDLDGLKLDFIDAFSLRSSTPVEDPRRDCVSLEEGIDLLLKEITEALLAFKPDFLIEFRQSYVGPAIRKYGNMLRAADCPNDALKNRERIADLRFTSGKTAVHSDMIMWNYEESVESAAVQVISVLFSVPQISVLLDRLSADHAQMLRFYLSFWKEHRELLLDGEFFALSPESLYTLAGVKKDGQVLAVNYADTVWEPCEDFTRLYCLNCHGKGSLTLRFPSEVGECQIKVLDCMGRVQREQVRHVSCGIFDMQVPPSGMLIIEKV